MPLRYRRPASSFVLRLFLPTLALLLLGLNSRVLAGGDGPRLAATAPADRLAVRPDLDRQPLRITAHLDRTARARQVAAPAPDETQRRALVRETLSSLVPTLTAALVDFPDPTGDNAAEPGEDIRYEITITNTSAEDATSVVFDAATPANTTFNAASVTVTPVAFDDAYAVLGNVGLNVPAGAGLLANDVDPDASGTLVVNTASVTRDAGSTVTGNGAFSVNADGSFTYDPPVGETGTEVFTYTVNDDGGTGLDCVTPGVVTFTISEVIWFIDNADGGANAGTLGDPFQSIAAFNASGLPGANDNIYLAETGTDYTTGLVLQSGQRLIGEGATGASLASLLGLTVPPNSNPLPAVGGTRPVIAPAAGDGLTLGGTNTIQGLNVENGAGRGIFGNAVGGTTNVSEVALNNNAGVEIELTGVTGAFNFDAGSVICVATDAIHIGGGSVAVTFTETPVTHAGGNAILINGGHSGSFAYLDDGTNQITQTGGVGVNIDGSSGTYTIDNVSVTGGVTGISVTNSGGATTTFRDVSIDAATGVNLTTAGTVTFSTVDGTNTVAATAGPGVNATTTTIGAGGWTFGTLSSTSTTTDGINLDGVGGGSFTASGGTITNSGAHVAVDLNALSAGFSYAGTIDNNAGGRSVEVTNSGSAAGGGNTITFSGSIDDDGTGIFLDNNDQNTNGATVNFTGGLALDTGSNTAFTATNGGTVNVTGTNTIGATTALSTTAVNINGVNAGASGITFASLSVTGGTATGISVQSSTGTKSLGTTNLATTNQTGFFASNAGTVNTSGGTINTGTASGIDIDNTALGIMLTSVTSTGGSAPGIDLNTTTGSFTVAGNGATGGPGPLDDNNGSGGTISNKSGDAVVLTNVTNVSLNYMNITNTPNTGDNGIEGTAVNGFVLNRSNVTGHGNNGSFEAPLFFRGLTGTAEGGTNPTVISNSLIADGDEDNIQIKNETGTLTRLIVRNSTIGSTSFGAGCTVGNPGPCRNSNDGINFEGLSTGAANAVMNITVENSTFIGNGADHINPFHNGTEGGSMDIVITGNDMSGSQSNPLGVGGGITIAANCASAGPCNTPNTMTYRVENNDITDVVLVAIDTNLAESTAGMTINGIIHNNRIGNTGAGTTECGSGSSTGVGIRARSNRAGTHIVAITNNTIRNWTNGGGITIHQRDGNGTLNATVTGNSEVIDAGCFAAFVAFGSGLQVESGAISGDAGTVCIDIGGAAALSNTLVEPNGFDPSILVLQTFNTTMRFPTYAGAATNPTAHTNLNTFLGGRNSLGPNGVAADPSQGPTFQGQIDTGVSGGAPNTCPQPVVPPAMLAGAIGHNTTPAHEQATSLALSKGVHSQRSPFQDANSIEPKGAPIGLQPMKPVTAVTSSGVIASVDEVMLSATALREPSTLRHNIAIAYEEIAAHSEDKKERLENDVPSVIVPTARKAAGLEFLASTERTVDRAALLAARHRPLMEAASLAASLPPAAHFAPTNLALGTLPAGKAVRVAYEVTIDDPLAAGVTSITGQGTVTADGGLSLLTDDPDDATGSDDPTITTLVNADLELTGKTDSPDPVSVGGQITYTIDLVNGGPDAAETVTVTDTTPTGTTFVSASVTSGTGWTPTTPSVGGTGDVVFSKATVANAETATFEIVVSVDAGATPGTNIDNTATAASATLDGDLSNNTAMATTTTQAVDLALSKADGDVTVNPGDDVVYTLTYINNGNQAASGVELTETVPLHTTFNDGASTTGWSCADGSPGGTVCTFTVGAVAGSGGTGTADFAVRVNDPFVANGTAVMNEATIADDGAETATGDNTAGDTTPVTNPLAVVINEVDYDQGGTDQAEFIELKNTGSAALDLSDYQVKLLHQEAGGAMLDHTFVLSGSLAPGAYYTICADPAQFVPGTCDLDVSPDADLIADADGATVTGTAVRLEHTATTTRVDAVAFEGAVDDNTETTAAGTDDPAMANAGQARNETSADTDDNSADFAPRCISPGAVNPASTDVSSCAGLSPLQLTLGVLLEAAWDQGTQQMKTTVGSHASFPTAQPFGSAPFSYSGTEEAATRPATTTDWLLLRLYSSPGATPTSLTLEATRAVLVLEDGTVHDPETGSSTLVFDAAAGAYWLEVIHARSLSVLSSSKIDFTGGAVSYDFTDAQAKAHDVPGDLDTTPMAALGGSALFGLVAGNGFHDRQINTFDYNRWFLQRTSTQGYYEADYNHDGVVNTFDYNVWFMNRGQVGQTP